MTNVTVMDFQRRVVEAMEDVIEQNMPLEVETQKGAVVILSAEEYKKISHHSKDKIPEGLRHLTPEQLEELEDEILLEMAEERMKNTDPSTWISQEEMWAEMGITEEDLEGWEDIEFE